MNEKCIFCEIVLGHIPASIIHETLNTITFLDINPVTRGHLIIIPKEHSKDVSETKDIILEEIIRVSKEIGVRLKERLGADGFNILNANGTEAQQSVFHTHFHIVPRYKNETLDLWFDTKSIGTNDHNELNELLGDNKT